MALIDWSAVAGILSCLYALPLGRPGYPPDLMMRALLPAQWYGLSDPELEEAPADRLSFRRFVGLSLRDAVPDETVLCRFRASLAANGLAENVMAEIGRQRDARGLILRTGTIIDASVVDAAVRKLLCVTEPSAHDDDANWLATGTAASGSAISLTSRSTRASS